MLADMAVLPAGTGWWWCTRMLAQRRSPPQGTSEPGSACNLLAVGRPTGWALRYTGTVYRSSAPAIGVVGLVAALLQRKWHARARLTDVPSVWRLALRASPPLSCYSYTVRAYRSTAVQALGACTGCTGRAHRCTVARPAAVARQ